MALISYVRVGVVLVILWVGSAVNAQTTRVDSLKQTLSRTDSLSVRYAHTLLMICNDWLEHSPDSALSFCQQALAAKVTTDSLKAQTMIKTSTAYSHKGIYDQSMSLALEGLRLGEKIKDTLAIIDAHTNLGIDFFIQEDYEKALGHFEVAERLSASVHDSIRLGHSINNIGLIVGSLSDYETEIKRYKEAREIFGRIGEREGYANTIMNLGTAYASLQRFPDAIASFEEALSIYQEIKYSAAEEQAYINLGETYLEMHEYGKALKAIYKSLDISERFNYRLDELYSIELLAKIHAAMKRYDSAYFYNREFVQLKDSLFNVEKQSIRSDMEAKYESEKKEQRIRQLQQETLIKDLQVREEQQWRNSLIMLSGSFGIIAILFFNRFRIKKRTSDLLNKKNEELRQLNGLKDRMFTVISHDLKSPLSAFSNLTRSLAENVKQITPDQIEQYLLNLNQSSQDLSRLLNNLLEWALTQTGSMVYKPEVVDCQLMVDEVISQLSPSLNEKSIRIEKFIPDNLTAYADRNMVIIVLRNLVSNAIKFSHEGGVITIYAGHKSKVVTLGVKDTGVGISTGDQNKLFKPEEDVHAVGDSTEKGTGIGLLLCRELVEKNGGNIYVESKLGEGSNFYFSLPESSP